MVFKIALVLSIFLQFAAFFITISLVKRTKFNVSWIAISIAFLFQAFRRVSDLVEVYNMDQPDAYFQFNRWIGILISALLFVASFYIRQIFNLQDRIEQLRKENESRVLSAIIKTEEKDRQQFAKELHDGLGPLLSTIKMSISAINLEVVGTKNRGIIQKTESAIDDAVNTVREISNNLSPHILEKFGILKAVRNFADSIITINKPLININSNSIGQRYEYNLEVVVYRIFCELINNTLKHADATRIDINFESTEKSFECSYSDNGKGFEYDENQIAGMGLSNIFSRVKSLNGYIVINTRQNQGFYLKITFPL